MKIATTLTAGAAIAHPDVEIAVGTEGEVAAIVVGIGLRDEALTSAAGSRPLQIEA